MEIFDKLRNSIKNVFCCNCNKEDYTLIKFLQTRWGVCPRCYPDRINELMDDQIRCPKCGSTQIAANKKGMSLGTELIGSQNVNITCLYCGESWPAGYYRITQELKDKLIELNQLNTKSTQN